MMLKQKKICIIFCAEPEVIGQSRVTEQSLAIWARNFFELSLIAKVDTKLIWQGNGLDLTHCEWYQVAQAIYLARNKYDGFVVLHSAEQVLFAANYAKLALASLKKPVVFTTTAVQIEHFDFGDEFFGDFTNFTSRNNVLNAMQTSCVLERGVVLLAGSSIVNAEKAIHTAYTHVNLFASVDDQPLGSITLDLDIKVKRKQIIKHSSNIFPKKIPKQVLFLDVNFSILPSSEELAKTDMLVIKAGEVNLVPSSWEKVLLDFSGLIVCYGIEPVNQTKLSKKTFFLSDMTFEQAAAQAVWAYGVASNQVKINKLLKS